MELRLCHIISQPSLLPCPEQDFEVSWKLPHLVENISASYFLGVLSSFCPLLWASSHPFVLFFGRPLILLSSSLGVLSSFCPLLWASSHPFVLIFGRPLILLSSSLGVLSSFCPLLWASSHPFVLFFGRPLILLSSSLGVLSSFSPLLWASSHPFALFFGRPLILLSWLGAIVRLSLYFHRSLSLSHSLSLPLYVISLYKIYLNILPPRFLCILRRIQA